MDVREVLRTIRKTKCYILNGGDGTTVGKVSEMSDMAGCGGVSQ